MTATPDYLAKLYRDRAHGYRWQIQQVHGRIVAESASYRCRTDCVRELARLVFASTESVIGFTFPLTAKDIPERT